MNTAIKRAVVLMLAFALVAAACGDDDATSTAATTASTDAPASTEAPTASTAAPTTTTTAAPATTQPAAMTPEEFVAEHNIALPADTELVSIEEVDGATRIGATVNATPPPGYAAMATAAGWTVIDVTFGSEITTAIFAEAVGDLFYCLTAYANYDSHDSPEYWMWFTFWTGLTEADCLGASSLVSSALSLLGSP